MFIDVYSLNGFVATFLQDSPEKVRQFVANFQPSKLFLQEKLLFAAEDSISMIPTSTITRIDFKSEGGAPLEFPMETICACELTASQFYALIRNPVMSKQWRDLNPRNQSVIIFLEAIMADHAKRLVTTDLGIGDAPDFNQIHESLLKQVTLCLRLQNGGVSMLNLANLGRLTLFAGSMHTPANAVPACLAQNESGCGKVFVSPDSKHHTRTFPKAV